MDKENQARLFVKECGIPINIYESPYFEERLLLFDGYFDTVKKWNRFQASLDNSRYSCGISEPVMAHMEHVNTVVNRASAAYKHTEGYKRFLESDVGAWLHRADETGINHTSIYRENNDGKQFLSVSMKKPEFQILNLFDRGILNSESWKEFISRFTDDRHIINSRRIRRMILPSCTQGKTACYGQSLMAGIICMWTHDIALPHSCGTIPPWRFLDFSGTRIILDAEGFNNGDLRILQESVCGMPVRVEMFTLYEIHGTDGYIERYPEKLKFKQVRKEMMPLVIRILRKEKVNEHDTVIMHKGIAAKMLNVPEISIDIAE